MSAIKKSIRLDEKLSDDIHKIAEEENTSETFVIESALKFYRDYYYTNEKATFLNQEIIKTLEAIMSVSIQKINNKTNQVLSELSIQNAIQNQILANELEVNGLRLQNFRANAVEYLKTNNRVFNLEELMR